MNFQCECGQEYEVTPNETELMPKRFEAARITLAFLNAQAQVACAVFEDLLHQVIERGKQSQVEWEEESDYEPDPVPERRGLIK